MKLYHLKKLSNEAMMAADADSLCSGCSLMLTGGLVPVVDELISRDKPEDLVYYYHSDHLGSSSFITDASGLPSQHYEYLPFGELFAEERDISTQYITPYKFTGKEHDYESGLIYYGARYYDPRTSVFLGVDPLSEKFPNISPFDYCLSNPVKFVDPDGRTPWPIAQFFKSGVRKIISGMFRNFGGAFHGGVDIVHKSKMGNLSGGTIIATHGGKVTASGYSKTAGNWVQITNGDIRTSYMHMEKASALEVGQKVNEYDPVGKVGSTGRSEGPHVHYQIEKYNYETQEWEKINPVEGDPQKVDQSMNVNLKDPQVMIDVRDNLSNSNQQNIDRQPKQAIQQVEKK